MIFVYGLIDPRTNELRYVGKTKLGMARPKQHWDKHNLKRNDKVHRWIKKLNDLGMTPIIEVLEETDLDHLSDIERFWIASIRTAGAMLLNMTEGGEGGAPIMSEEIRTKLSFPGKSNPFFGRKHSEETKAAISHKNTGKRRAKLQTKSCLSCGESFTVSLGKADHEKKLFCSKKCFWSSGRLRYKGKYA